MGYSAAPLDRIWTERATLDLLHTILPAGVVPTVLFEDRVEYLFAMTCAPDDAVTWKTHLMAGQIDPDIAARLGLILGMLHAQTPTSPALREPYATRACSEELHGSAPTTVRLRVPIRTLPHASLC